MKRLIVVVVILMGMPILTLAKPQGKGIGRQQKEESVTKQAVKRVTNEAVDALLDELVGEDNASSTSSGTPPGLSKKGKLPPGLEKKDKVPPGWSKGKKQGWNGKAIEEPKKESFLRRAIRGIFRGGKSKED